MNKITTLIVCLVLIWTNLLTAQNGFWETVSGPPGGEATQMFEHPDGTLFAELGDFSVYRSQDGGSTWTQIAEPRENRYVYFGAAGALFRRDAGEVIQANFKTYDMYLSNDQGNTWIKILDDKPIYSITQVSANKYFGISYLGVGGYHSTLYQSDDVGINWTDLPIYVITEGDAPEIFSTSNEGLFVSNPFGHDLYSVDNGVNWTEYINSDIYFNHVENYPILTANKSWLLSNIEYRIILSPTGELTIIDANNDGITQLLIQGDTKTNLLMADNRLIIAEKGINYESSDNGLTWQPNNENLEVIKYPLRKPSSQGTLFGNSNGFTFVKQNSTTNWKHCLFPSTKGIISQLEGLNSDTLFIKNSSGFWKTKDAGLHWENKIPYEVSLLKNENHGKLIQSGNLIFLTYNKKMYRSEDAGETFIELTIPNNGLKNNSFCAYSQTTNHLFANSEEGIIRSNNKGETWETINVAFDVSGKLYAVLEGNLVGNSGITAFTSTNSGIDWISIPNSAWLEFENVYAGKNSDIVYIAYGQNQMISSSDNGFSWAQNLAFADDNYLYPKIGLDNEGSVFFSYNRAIYVKNDLNGLKIPLPNFPTLFYKINTLFVPDDEKIYVEIRQFDGNPTIYRSNYTSSNFPQLTGKLSKVISNDCSNLQTVSPIANWVVKAQGTQFTNYARTDENGDYKMYIFPETIEISVEPGISPLWSVCNNNTTINASGNLTTHDIYASTLGDCAFMQVDVFISRLERCFNNFVVVSYCNYGNITAENPWIDLQLDPNLSITSSQNPYTNLGNNLYRFDLGNVPAETCGSFDFQVYVSCDSTQIGQTHCIEAHAYPDSVCVDLPSWNGANLIADATCLGDTTVRFTLTNNGTGIANGLDYVVIEDDIVIKLGNGNLNPNETLTVDCPANSKYMRIEATQVTGHPFSLAVAAWVEGCPDISQFNWVNQYFLDDGWPSKDVECLPNVGSFDPNDKTGYPLGYSSAHFINANTDLEYVIRFQNTGTAPAHKVVIRDTLSKLLDASQLRIGTASHAYTWDITGEGYLEFTFDDINLPDSMSDEAGSHGYISFKIVQQPYLPDGTILNNQASIYFDFNAPIVTNKTEHQVKYNFLTVSLENPTTKSGKTAKVYPNPTHDEATFYFPEMNDCENQFILTDLQGKVVRNEAFCGEYFYFKRNELGNGVYFLKVMDVDKKELWRGKLVVN
jgi:uncharacterized repeat protein (TIGR01451 family)